MKKFMPINSFFYSKPMFQKWRNKHNCSSFKKQRTGRQKKEITIKGTENLTS